MALGVASCADDTPPPEGRADDVLPPGAIVPPPPQTDAILGQSIEVLVPKDGVVDQPGYAFGIVSYGAPIGILVEGAASIEHARPITPQTVFHIASLSKQITASALVHAIRDELVDIEAPVSTYLPELAAFGDSLTVSHLVYMTSGVPEYYEQARPGDQVWATFDYFDIDDAIQSSLETGKLAHRPGAEWRYSNINYMLISKIVSRVYERPFSEVVEEKVFAPLGMTNSLIHDDATMIVPGRATAYSKRTEENREMLATAGVQTGTEGALMMLHRNSPPLWRQRRLHHHGRLAEVAS